MAKCLICKDPEKPIQTRGVCSGCYQKVRKLVLSEKTTWPSLVARGWVEDRTSRGRHAGGGTDEELITQANIAAETELDVVWICQEPGCEFIAVDAEQYSVHRKETNHYLKMEKRTADLEKLKNLSTSIPDELREMANIILTEEGGDKK